MRTVLCLRRGKRVSVFFLRMKKQRKGNREGASCSRPFFDWRREEGCWWEELWLLWSVEGYQAREDIIIQSLDDEGQQSLTFHCFCHPVVSLSVIWCQDNSSFPWIPQNHEKLTQACLLWCLTKSMIKTDWRHRRRKQIPLETDSYSWPTDSKTDFIQIAINCNIINETLVFPSLQPFI